MRQVARFCALVFAVFVFAISADFNRALAQTPTPTPIQAGQVIISEFRLRGPAGPEDEFIELYNNTNSPIIVQSLDGSGGWTVAISNGQITGPLFTIPNGTTIPARGHLLGANVNGYSLSGYPSGNPTPTPTPSPTPIPTPGPFATAQPDRTWDFDVPDGSGVALFATTNGTNFTAGTRLDAAGFTISPALYKEGNGIPSVVTANLDHTYYRDLRTGGLPRDTGDNSSDFLLVGTAPGGIQINRLGAPGPENLASPIVNNATINSALLDPTVVSSSPPNRVRSFTTEDPNVSLFGTMLIRRTITNNTGQPVSRLRFRIINITTTGTPGAECTPSPCADLRALTSDDEQAVATSQGTVVVRGVRLEEPPEQPAGGGYNASLSADFITLATPLAAGASVNVVFKLGVQRTGPFRFFVNFEAQNGSAQVINGPAASSTGPAKDFTRKKVIADTVRSAPGAAPAIPEAAPSAAPGSVYVPFYINLMPTPAADDEEEKEKEGEGKEKKSEETPPSAEPAPPQAADAAHPAADEAAPQPAETQRTPQKKQPAAAKARRDGNQ